MNRILTAAVLSLSALGAVAAFAANARSEKPSDPAVTRNLATFDDLDFNVYSHEKWGELSKSHAKDIVVHWPDGHTTKGIETHISDLKQMFVFAPDNRIVEHPIKFGSGEYTAVSGFLLGTFSRPMPLPDGKSIPATGKAYKVPMVTIGHWNAQGVMDEEYLYWDNQTFMQQIGLAK